MKKISKKQCHKNFADVVPFVRSLVRPFFENSQREKVISQHENGRALQLIFKFFNNGRLFFYEYEHNSFLAFFNTGDLHRRDHPTETPKIKKKFFWLKFYGESELSHQNRFRCRGTTEIPTRKYFFNTKYFFAQILLGIRIVASESPSVAWNVGQGIGGMVE